MQTVTINDEQIPVEVGQVWAATGKDRYARVIDVDGLLVAYWFCEAGSRKAVSVDVGYFITFTTLIKHRGADIDLEKYRYLWDQMPDDCTDCIDGYCRLRIRRKQEPEYCECGYTTYQARWGYTTVQFYKNRFELLTRDAHCNVCKNKINPVWTWNEGDPRPPKMPKNTENRYGDRGAWVQTGATSIKQLHVYMNNSNGSYRWSILDNPDVYEPVEPEANKPAEKNTVQFSFQCPRCRDVVQCEWNADTGQVEMHFAPVGGEYKEAEQAPICPTCNGREPFHHAECMEAGE